MPIIDDDGRLFGAINVIDALVVLLVLAVALAGITLVAGGDSVEPETHYATLDFGSQPDFIVEQINEGDTSSLENQFGNLTITDLHVSPGTEGTQAIAKVAVTGQATDEQFTYDGATLQLGRTLEFESDEYNVTGTIRNTGDGPDLEQSRTPVVLNGTAPTEIANNIAPGDEVGISGRTTAVIDAISAYDTDTSDRKDVFLVANLSTYRTGNTVRYGDTQIQPDQSINLPLDGFQFTGEIIRQSDSLDQRTREGIITTTVDTEVANRIDEGDTYRVAGEPVATVENHSVYGADDPNEKRIYLGLALETLNYGGESMFGSANIRSGATIPFDAETYNFSAQLVRTDTADLQQSVEHVVVNASLDADTADQLAEGDTYRVADRSIATIQNLTVYGTSDPNRKQAIVGLSLQTLNFRSEPIFSAERPVRGGATIPFRTNDYGFAGDIVRVDTLEPRGTETTQTVTLKLQNTTRDRADDIQSGMTETSGQETLARLTDVRTEPATIVLTSESGEIFARDHPVNKDLAITAELTVRETTTGTRFKGSQLQIGQEVTLDLGSITVEATVTAL